MTPRGTRSNRRRVAAVGAALVFLAAGAALVRAGGTEHPARSPGEDHWIGRSTDAGSGTSAPAVSAGDGAVFAQDESGAAAAAARFVASSQRWLYLADGEVRDAVLEISTAAAGPGLAELTVADVAAARAELGRSPGAVWWVVHPLATRVVSFTPGGAEVEVWTVTVLAAVDVAAPQAEWLTVSVELAWTAGGWRVESIRDRPGPSPMLGPRDQPWDAAPFAEALEGFERLDGGRLDGEVAG